MKFMHGIGGLCVFALQSRNWRLILLEDFFFHFFQFIEDNRNRERHQCEGNRHAIVNAMWLQMLPTGAFAVQMMLRALRYNFGYDHRASAMVASAGELRSAKITI